MVQGIGLGLAQFHSGCRDWGRMVEEVPEEENYQEPQKAWQRIFKREWSPGMAKGPGGNTGTDMARVRLWNLGKKRGKGAGTEALSEARTGAGAGASLGTRSGARLGTGVEAEVGAGLVGSLDKESSKGRTMAYGEVEGRVRRGKRRQTGGSWSPSRRSGEEKEGRDEEGEEWVEEEGMEEGREEGDADSWPPYVEYPTDWNRTKYFKI